MRYLQKLAKLHLQDVQIYLKDDVNELRSWYVEYVINILNLRIFIT